MPEERDRIEQIRERRSKGRINPQASQQQQQVYRRVQRSPKVEKVGAVSATAAGAVRAGTPSPWLKDRVTLSLEAQIAMIEMRATQRLTLADMGYRNRYQLISIRPGIFLKLEPTGCYRMTYHNRI